MTLEEKIGQMLLLGWQGADAQGINDHAAALVDDLAAGGVIVFTRNVGTPDRLRETLTGLQARALARGLPPLFAAIDQEGGRVSRLPAPQFSQWPTAREIGDTGEPARARETAREIAGQLKPLGINWDFAPVLDVNNNPKNPVIGDRSYGDEAQLVAAMGIAAVRGFQEDGGMLACGKHFPGHGDTDTDSHLALPRIAHGQDRLEQVELVPFRAAIASGLAAIMTAHILFPALDPDLPATLSLRILTGLLRDSLDFQGVIITDCLEMKGVARGWGTPEAGVLAVLAGADILLCCHTWETQRALRDALVAAVQSGRIPERRIDESLVRIAAAKTKWVA